MSAMVCQITGVSIVYSNVCSCPDQIKHQSSALLAFLKGFTGDRWISRTEDQQRGKCFHLMRSSWHKTVTTSSHYLTCDFRFILSWNNWILSSLRSILQTRDHSGYGVSQWEQVLQCNVWSHWPSPCPEWSMKHSQMSLHSSYMIDTWCLLLLQSTVYMLSYHYNGVRNVVLYRTWL